MKRMPVALAILAPLAAACLVLPAPPCRADEVTSKHQMMKDCMAKQKASDGGMPKEQMKKSCRDVTKTEHENAAAEKKSEDKPAPPSAP
jgi:hypothetical protein